MSTLNGGDTGQGGTDADDDNNPIPALPRLRSQDATQPAQSASVTGTVQEEESPIDCAICLDQAVFPVELPCRHAFCYLCLKGTALLATQQGQGPRCSICRSDIPLHVLSNPPLKDSAALRREPPPDQFQWYYECRSGGWWQFEERQNTELERSFEAKEPKCTLLIAGQMYEIDFLQMIQYRPSTRHVIRRIKRDIASSTQLKGIAGIRINSTQSTSSSQSQGLGTNNGDSANNNGNSTVTVPASTTAAMTVSATALLSASALTAIATGNLGSLASGTGADDGDSSYRGSDDDDDYDGYNDGSDFSDQSDYDFPDSVRDYLEEDDESVSAEETGEVDEQVNRQISTPSTVGDNPSTLTQPGGNTTSGSDLRATSGAVPFDHNYAEVLGGGGGGDIEVRLGIQGNNQARANETASTEDTVMIDVPVIAHDVTNRSQADQDSSDFNVSQVSQSQVNGDNCVAHWPVVPLRWPASAEANDRFVLSFVAQNPGEIEQTGVASQLTQVNNTAAQPPWVNPNLTLSYTSPEEEMEVD